MQYHHQALFASLISVFLVACGGGGGGGKKPADNTTPPANLTPAPGTPTNPVNGTPVNSDVTGHVYFRWINGYVKLDLATGIVERLRNESWGEKPAPNGQEFAQIYDGYTSFGPDTDILDYFGHDGRTTHSVEFAENLNLVGPVRISPDARYTAVYFDYDNVYSSGEDGLVILDRAGNVLHKITSDDISSWDWLANGHLAYTMGDAIYALDEVAGNERLIKRFTGQRPQHLTANAAGTHLMFTFWDESSEVQQIYTSRVDGSEQRLVATTNTNKNAPAWSPDGQQLAVQAETGRTTVTFECPTGYECAPMPPIVSECLDIRVISATADNVDVTRDGASKVIRTLDDQGRASLLTCAESIAWQNPQPALPSSPGTAPDRQQFNGGLSGQMLISGLEDGEDLMSLNLQNGTLTVHPSQYNGTLRPQMSSSRDGQEIIFLQPYADSGAHSSEQLKVQRFDGTLTANFEIRGKLAGIPRLSPDGNHIAIYHTPEYGEGNAALKVFNRAGDVVGEVGDFTSWDWLPDGRLIVTRGGDIFITNRQGDTPERLATLSNGVGDLAINPTGNVLAFKMLGHLWTLQLDGQGLKQLTTSQHYEMLPAWSPDGNHIGFKYHEGNDTCQLLFVVPSNGERIYVGNDGVNSSAIKITQTAEGRPAHACQYQYFQSTWR